MSPEPLIDDEASELPSGAPSFVARFVVSVPPLCQQGGCSADCSVTVVFRWLSRRVGPVAAACGAALVCVSRRRRHGLGDRPGRRRCVEFC